MIKVYDMENIYDYFFKWFYLIFCTIEIARLEI